MKAAEYQLRNVTSDKVTVLLLCKLTYTQPGLGTHGRMGVFRFSCTGSMVTGKRPETRVPYTSS